jgi:hypothetical protein
MTQGDDTWSEAITGGACYNVAWANESSVNFDFCTSSIFPANTQWETAFESYATSYALAQGCGSFTAACYDNAGSDGADFGPDWSTLLTLTDAALTGGPISPGRPRR